MKKIQLLTLLLSTTLLISSCIKEDMSDCPWVKLSFSYVGDTNDESMFGKMIQRVTLYCFDSITGALVMTKTIDKAELDILQGTDLYLAPGQYKIISYANAMNDTEIIVTASSSGKVHHPNFPLGKNIPTNDHLYYGEYNLTVPNSGIATGVISHKAAHINVEVYVEGAGYKDQPQTWPTIEMDHLMPEYTIQMENAQPFNSTYYPTVDWEVSKTEFEGQVARFQVLRFADKNDIVVSVKSPVGTLMHSVKLQDFLAANSIKIGNRNEVTISILFKFTDLGVSITLPDWTNVPVKPEI